MTLAQTQKLIAEKKKKADAVILAHSYVGSEILEIADETGDSFALSKAALKYDASVFIVCGVHFMAETVKLLSPSKRVILANSEAGCPMAEQFTAEDILRMKAENPGCAAVCYINTTAAIKSVCDVCVTSATAVKICRQLKNDSILFIPDKNLGSYCAQQIPEKHFILTENGGCPVHSAVSADEVTATKQMHPNALLLSHPECPPYVLEQSDFVGSTSAIVEYARQSDANEFIIGTEISIREQLSRECPEKRFYMLSKQLVCRDMRITTLSDVLAALDGTGGAEITMSEELITSARRCIDEMLRLG